MRVITAASALTLALLLSIGSAATLYAQGGERPKSDQPPEAESGNQPKQHKPGKKNTQQTEVQAGPSVNDSASIGTFVVDPQLAEQGANVWINKGCDVCHGIGQGKITGPDLQNVQLRHNKTWLENWIRDPAEVARTDPYAKGLVAGYNHIVMPNLELTDQQIDEVINYIARESQEKSQ